MRVDEFWIQEETATGTHERFDVELVRELRRAPLEGRTDVEAGVALAALLRDQFTRYGTDSSETLDDEDSREAMRALTAVAGRLGIAFSPPFRDLSAFRAYWGSHGGYGSWATRRSMVTDVFAPLEEELERREDELLRNVLAEPISPRGSTAWPAVDTEIAELRRHFHTARTPQDYRNIGNDVVAVLEALSAAAYDASRHLREGEAEPPVSQTKNRLGRVIEVDAAAEESDELVKLARATIEFAQAVKHNPAGSRRGAGIAADSAIQLTNLIRRVQEPG